MGVKGGICVSTEDCERSSQVLLCLENSIPFVYSI